jgi:carnitine 3-dehydrogenase
MRKIAAIIGGGVIGGGWLARFLLNGWDVNLYDPDPESKRKIKAVLENARHALPMLYDVNLPVEGSLNFCESIKDAVEGATWIQESVPERLDLKHKVFNEIINHASSDAVIGSSTSGFKPSELQEGSIRPDSIIVTHPFNPVYLLPLIELVPSPANSVTIIDKAKEILTSLGMFPLHVRKEIDAHIADRFLEAVWREGLWLIKDGIATTQEIDDAIRYGFGLRWAQMGLFETYRIAGGEEGMAHFISQFGPCLQWPWTKLMDVPELTDELIEQIANQSDAQSGHKSIRELERLRDNNLIAILRSLKNENTAAGALINNHEKTIKPELPSEYDNPITTINRVIPNDWTDYNGHMNESRYGQIFSDAADIIMKTVGANEAYIASGLSYFTVDIAIKFLAETHAGSNIHVKSYILQGEGKKMRLFHQMYGEDGTLMATGEQMLIHVSLETRRACEPRKDVLTNLERIAAAHSKIEDPRGGKQ